MLFNANTILIAIAIAVQTTMVQAVVLDSYFVARLFVSLVITELVARLFVSLLLTEQQQNKWTTGQRGQITVNA